MNMSNSNTQEMPKTKTQKLVQTIVINECPTFIRYGTKVERFALSQSIGNLEAHARNLGADRVYVTKNLTNGSRPLMFKFHNGSKFLNNHCLNTVLEATA